MNLNHRSVRLKSIACLFLAGAFLSGCQKKNDIPVPPAKPNVGDAPVTQAVDTGSKADTTKAAASNKDTVRADTIPRPARVLAFRSRPSLKSFPGRPFQYRPILSQPGPFQLRVVKGPDSMIVV